MPSSQEEIKRRRQELHDQQERIFRLKLLIMICSFALAIVLTIK